MLKIGEFSKLSRISVRMLRHYDEIGLLKPAEIDRFTVGGRSSFRDGTPSQRGEPLRAGNVLHQVLHCTSFRASAHTGVGIRISPRPARKSAFYRSYAAKGRNGLPHQ